MSWHAFGAWWRPYITSESVYVSHVDLRPEPVHEAAALALLDQVERSQRRKYLAGPGRRFSLCRAALRSILCALIGCRNDELSFGVSSHGKPFALLRGVRCAVSFNVSHSGDNGLIAFSNGGARVGVDLEERVAKQNLGALIEAVMGPEEQAQLALLQGPERLRLFYHIWTCKEALIKALGTRFATDVSQFQIPLDCLSSNERYTFRFPHVPCVSWALEDISNDKFAAALAWERPVADYSPGPRLADPESRT